MGNDIIKKGYFKHNFFFDAISNGHSFFPSFSNDAFFSPSFRNGAKRSEKSFSFRTIRFLRGAAK